MKSLNAVLIGSLLFISMNLAAQTIPPVVSVKYLNTLTTVPSSFTVTENEMNTEVTAGPPIPFKDKAVHNYVKLAIDPGKDDFISAGVEYKVDVEIKFWNVNGTFTAFTNDTVHRTLKINYSPNNSALITDINLYSFQDAYKIQVKVTQVYVNGSAYTSYSSLPNCLYIEAGIEVERYYDFDFAASPDDLEVVYDEDYQYLNIQNFSVDGAVAYEIEWTYVNNYGSSLASNLTPSQLTYTFHNNSSRIRVNSDEIIKIPAVFDRGYVIVRARGIGRTGPNLDKDWYGPWTITDNYDDDLSDPYSVNTLIATTYIVEIGASGDQPVFESNKNWMYQVTFAEEGKMKHIISYFDGTSRNRQSVTVLNTDNEAIVAETFYDHQGRAVAQSLPVPVDRDLVGSDYVPNKHLNYYENFNLSDEATPVKFNRLNFDIDAGLECDPVQIPFSTESGAGKYYSPDNQIQNKHNAFIPDAEGYAYTLTEFMPDNTGRVRRQTGVGPDHNLNGDLLGNYHYTSYFYGKPFQEELDRLFGTNVGDAAHYQKNMIIDPNGQVSISYLDMKGNVIATALAGEAPTNVQSLKVDGTGDNLFESVLETQTIDLLDVSGEEAHGSNNELSDDGMTYSMYAPILVTSESDYTFLYSIKEKEYLEECLSAICFDCVYNIDITLLDLCGNPAGSDGVDIHQTIGDIPVIDGTGTSLECDSIGEFTLNGSAMIAENVPTGLYYLNKNLSINTEALETYANLYIQELEAIENPEVDLYSAELDGAGSDGIEDALQDADHDGIIGEEANCFMTFDEFYHTALENVDISDCDISCDDCAIVQNQTLSEFIIAHTVSETPEEAAALEESYNEALAFCDAMCSSPGNDFCLMAKNMMLADMSPGGQYAKYFNDAEATIDPEIDPVSILNEYNVLQNRVLVDAGMTNWRHPARFIDGDWEQGYFNEDGTERVLLLVTGTGADMSPSSFAPFTGLDGNTYTYPEHLNNVEDFIELFQSSWAQSLIGYHPEYYYYEDCLELYTPDEDVEISGSDLPDCFDCNTYQFDEYLLNLDFEDVFETVIDNPTNFDPFFDNYTLTEKGEFYNKFITGIGDTYGECGFDIYQFAWLAAHTSPAFYGLDCSGVEDEIDLIGTTSWDLMADENVWKNFVLSYISAKYQFWLEHADDHVDDDRAYHGCIGNDYNFQYSSDVVTPFDDIEELWEDDYVCGLPQGVFLSDKVSRFPNINDMFDIGDEDLETALDALLNDADIAYFEATGNEPLAYDLELFLSGLLEVAGGWLPTATFDITDILSLTPRLNTELIDLGLTTWNPTFTDITETEIEWGTGPCLTLALPDDTHAFIDILSLHDIHVTNPVTGEFEIIADFAALDPDDDNIEVILTGQYCGSLDASPFPTTDCELSDGAGAVWSVMNAILVNDLGGPTDNFHTTTATSINTISGYDLSSGIKPQLQEYLGETLPYKWKYNSTDDYFSLLSNDLSKSINIYFTTTIATSIDYLKLMEPLAEPDFAGLTNDFTIVSVDGATELGFAGFMEWQWESEIYTFPVGECDFPVELFCNDKENLNRADLEALFAALIDDEDFVPEIGDAVSLETYPEYTDNLEILTGHPTFDDSWNVTFNDGHEMHATFVSYNASVDENIENCFASFNIEDATITDNIDDDDLGELISLTGDYTYTFSDYTYNFILEIETPEVDTLYIQGSTTCIPIKDCDDCHQEITDIYEDYSPSVVTVDHTVTGGISTVSVGVAVLGGSTDAANVSATTSFATIKGIGNNRASRQDTVDVASNTTKKFMMYARYVSTIIDTLYKQTSGGNMKAIARLGDTPPTKPEYTVDEDCMDDLKAYPLVESDNDCIDQQLSLAYANALDAYNNYILELKNTFKDNYVSHCMSALETFSMQYEAGEYHYTLYYYDQADNVVMTVPPAGVQFVDESDFDDIDDYRDNVLAAVPVTPMHTLTTRYAYNSLNQLKWQSTPDGGESRFWYDRLGRMVLSQNAKQNKIYEDGEDVEFEKYSYTSYDDLSRIDQVGELWTTPNIEDQHAIESDPIDFDEEINKDNFPEEIAAYRKEVTRTVYDIALNLTTDPPFGVSGQQNLRKRISSVYYEDAYDGDIDTYNHATHYSYDIHGNVHTIIQDNPNLATLSEQFKTIKYEFDLISGNVNKVIYQDGDVDRFYHKYFYDADNRISEVYTSRDNIIWERDAKYFYYRHGPLARAEVGDLIVQGVDYAYTIHGWLKGVNAGALNATRDMGGDGQGSNYRKNIGIDAFGFILDYYEGDYAQINSGTNSFIPAAGTSGFSDVTANLFNGNIRAMTTAIMQTTVTSNKHVIAPTLGKAYRYDQLNRLTESLSYEKSTMHQTGQFTWAGVSSTNKWATKYAYDANGNILSMLRAGNLGGAYDMDSLTYSYNSNNNQLQYVTDDVGDGVYTDIDVDNQDVDNYVYDEIGNMISDDQGEINAITWNVYGKITSIDKVSGADLEFAYDATGNRISKKVIESGQPTKTTYYVRDAQGNVMAVYTRETSTGGSPTDTLFLSEQHIYGSSRLGYVQTKVKMTNTIPTSGYYSRVLGEKSYELSNHLGNVLAVVSDRRFAVEGSGATAGKIKYFEPDVLSSQDYDPFGMITVGRNWEVGSEYRYGFGGKESDIETYGDGNVYDYGFRIYNPRLGRFLSVDPLFKGFAELTTYQYASNMPIFAYDIDGLQASGATTTPTPACNPINPVIDPTGTSPQPQVIIDPNAQVKEYKYTYTTEVKNGRIIYTFWRTQYYYNIPLTKETIPWIEREDGKATKIGPHEFERGKNFEYVGPFGRSSGGVSLATAPTLSINENGGSDGDVPSTKTFTVAVGGPAVFNGTFNTASTPTLGTMNSITIIDAGTGAVILPSTGLISGTFSITGLVVPSGSMIVTIAPAPGAALGAGPGGGADIDNWELSGNLVSTVPATTAASGSTAVFNSSEDRNVSGNLYDNRRCLPAGLPSTDE